MNNIDKSNQASSQSIKEYSNSYIYRDFSHTSNDGSYKWTPLCHLSPAAIRVMKLPQKLCAILSMPEYSHIITWMPHGRSWRVINIRAFVEEVMMRFFEYSNYSSFIRLVNAWGFRRITSGPDNNSYYHELFLRGVPHLLGKMHRLTNKEKKIPVDQRNEPVFYKLSESHPLPPLNNSCNSPLSTISDTYDVSVDSGLSLLSSVAERISEQPEDLPIKRLEEPIYKPKPILETSKPGLDVHQLVFLSKCRQQRQMQRFQNKLIQLKVAQLQHDLNIMYRAMLYKEMISSAHE